MIKSISVLSMLVLGSAAAGNAAPTAEVRAEYESVISHTQADGAPTTDRSAWSFERGSDYVIVRSADRNVEERWTRDDGRRVWYTRIFHKQKRAIEYAPVDLSMTGAITDWDQIRSIISPSALEALSKVERNAHTPVNTTVYRGEQDGKRVELHWLDREQLPSFIQKEDRDGVQTMRLLSVHVSDDPSLQPPAIDFSDYDMVDFADIGDRHHDPFIERMTRFEGVLSHR